MRQKCFIYLVLAFFLVASLAPQGWAQPLLDLPEPGRLVSVSPPFDPPVLKGITIHADNPFRYDFLIDPGRDRLTGEALKREGETLIKYFLASLALPEKDVWVNLSPYEKGRIIPSGLAQTDMGRDMLAQDYVLKQMAASFIYPEHALGKAFWEQVYRSGAAANGAPSSVPVNIFNKVWIKAEKAEIFERNQTAFVVKSHLKVMLEEDYLAAAKHAPVSRVNARDARSLRIIRNIVVPELEHEVNTGRNFARLRQIFNSMILAAWYKRTLKDALLNKTYADRARLRGIDADNDDARRQIYERYVTAYKKGVFNYIKEEPVEGQLVPRKYFSGGVVGEIDFAMTTDPDRLRDSLPDRPLQRFDTLLSLPQSADRAMAPRGKRQAADLTPLPGERVIHPVVGNTRTPITVKNLREDFQVTGVKYAKTPAGWGYGQDVRNDSFGGNPPHYVFALTSEKYPGTIVLAGRNDIQRVYSRRGPLSRDTFVSGTEGLGVELGGRVFQWLERNGIITRVSAESEEYYLESFDDKTSSLGQDPDTQLRAQFPDEADLILKFLEEKIIRRFAQISVYQQFLEDQDEEIAQAEYGFKELRRMTILFGDRLGEGAQSAWESLRAAEAKYGMSQEVISQLERTAAVFEDAWAAMFPGAAQRGVTMKNFFYAWNSFNEDLLRLSRKAEREGAVERGFIENKDELKAVVTLVQKLNAAVGDHPGIEARRQELTRSPEFLPAVERMIEVFNRFPVVLHRKAAQRLDIGRGAPVEDHADDRVRSGYEHAAKAIRALLEKYMGKAQGQPMVINVGDDSGRLREGLKAPVRMVDLVRRLPSERGKPEEDDTREVVKARIDLLDSQGLPRVEGASTAAGDLHLQKGAARAVVLNFALAGLRPEALRRATAASFNLLASPDTKEGEEPLLIIALPQENMLSGTPYEDFLFQMGFHAVAVEEDYAFELSEQGRDQLRARVEQDMRDRGLPVTERDIKREFKERLEFMRKPVHVGVYARTRAGRWERGADGFYSQYAGEYRGLQDIPEGLSITRRSEAPSIGAAKARQGLPGVIPWDAVSRIENLIGLENELVPARGESTEIFYRGDERLRGFESDLDAVQWALDYIDGAGIRDLQAGLVRDLEAARGILHLWDEERFIYARPRLRAFMSRLVSEMRLSRQQVDEMLPRERLLENVRPYGRFSVDDILAGEFHDRLAQHSGNGFSIKDVHSAYQQALRSSQAAREIRVRIERFIEQQMADGLIPTADAVFFNLNHFGRGGAQHSWRSFLMLLRAVFPAQEAQASEWDQLQELVRSVVRRVVHRQIDAITPNIALATPGRVAPRLHELSPYFRTLHHNWREAGRVHNTAETLYLWEYEFHSGHRIFTHHHSRQQLLADADANLAITGMSWWAFQLSGRTSGRSFHFLDDESGFARQMIQSWQAGAEDFTPSLIDGLEGVFNAPAYTRDQLQAAFPGARPEGLGADGLARIFDVMLSLPDPLLLGLLDEQKPKEGLFSPHDIFAAEQKVVSRLAMGEDHLSDDLRKALVSSLQDAVRTVMNTGEMMSGEVMLRTLQYPDIVHRQAQEKMSAMHTDWEGQIRGHEKAYVEDKIRDAVHTLTNEGKAPDAKNVGEVLMVWPYFSLYWHTLSAREDPAASLREWLNESMGSSRMCWELCRMRRSAPRCKCSKTICRAPGTILCAHNLGLL